MKKLSLKHKVDTWGYDKYACPVCGKFMSRRSLKRHISKAADREHRNFYDKNTKLVPTVKRVWDIEFNQNNK